MSRKAVALLLVGVVLALLGLLWFLQGANIVHLRPLLCVADCEPITGASPMWQAIGATVFALGLVLIWIGAKRLGVSF